MNPKRFRRWTLPLAAMTWLTNLTGCGWNAQPTPEPAPNPAVVLIADDGPFVLMEDVAALIAVENPPNSGKLVPSSERVLIRKGMTVVKYDWSKKARPAH